MLSQIQRSVSSVTRLHIAFYCSDKESLNTAKGVEYACYFFYDTHVMVKMKYKCKVLGKRLG